MDEMERQREPVRELTRDERTVLVFALRSAAPRHTYAFDIASDVARPYMRQFPNDELETILRDLEILMPGPEFGGDADQRLVKSFMAYIEAILEERRSKPHARDSFHL